MNNPRVHLAWVVALALVLPVSSAGQDEQPDMPRSHHQQVEEARTQYINGDWESSLVTSTAVIDALADTAGEDGAETEQHEILKHAREIRALAYFNLSREEEAEADFSAILSMDPTYIVPEEYTFPVLSEFFRSVKDKTIGTVTFTIDPPDAAVKIDGKEPESLENIQMTAGNHMLYAERAGFATYSAPFSVDAGTSQVVTVTLERTSATVTLWTAPAGVEVFLDGKSVGVTSGTADASMADAAAAVQVPLAELSASFVIEEIPLGQHELSFSKDCYRSEKWELPMIDEARDYTMREPVVLQQQQAGFALENVPDGAVVLVNGEEQAAGRYSFRSLCPGEYYVEVIAEFGRFSKTLQLEDKAMPAIPVELRPAIMYARPFYGDAAVEETERRRGADRIQEILADISGFDWVAPQPDNAEDLATLRRALDLATGEDFKRLSDEAHLLVRQLCRSRSAQIILLPVFSSDRLGQQFDIALLSFEMPHIELVSLNIDDPSSSQQFKQAFDEKTALWTTWHGITAIDTRMHNGPVVLRVQKDSPADRAGIKPGQVIITAGQSGIENHAALTQTMLEAETGEGIDIGVTSGGQRQQLQVVLARSPNLLPVFSDNRLYAPIIASLILQAAGAEDPLQRSVANMNIALALSHFGAWEEAIQYLRRVDMGDGPGINQGTVHYYMGVGFEQLGYRNEALEQYRMAAAFSNATLENNDGPQLAARIVQRIEQLETAP